MKKLEEILKKLEVDFITGMAALGKILREGLPKIVELKNDEPIPIGSLCKFWDNTPNDHSEIAPLDKITQAGDMSPRFHSVTNVWNHAKPLDEEDTPLPWQWNRGTCPKQLERYSICFVELRDGHREFRQDGWGEYRWTHTDGQGDIMKFAIVKFKNNV